MNSEKMSQNAGMAMPTDRMANQGVPNAGFLSLAGLMAAAGKNMGQGSPFMGGSHPSISSGATGSTHSEGPMPSSSGSVGGSGGGMANVSLPSNSGGGMVQEGSSSVVQPSQGVSAMQQQQQQSRPPFPGLLNSSEWNWSDFSTSQEGANALLERGRSRNWTYEETLELIGLYTSDEWQGKFGTEKKNHRAIWAALAAALSKRKEVSGDEARQRLNNLKALYNRTRRQLLAGEITSPQWEYWEPLHAFLGRPQPFLPLPPASPLPQFPGQPFQHFQGSPQNMNPMSRTPEGPPIPHFPNIPPHTAPNNPHHNPHALLGALGLAPPFGGFHGNGNPFHKTDRNVGGYDGRSTEGEDRKINVASMAPGNIVSSMDENSAGSGEAHHACDEVSVPLSPEQFLSEETERGTSPGTPSSQRPESYKLRHNNHLTLVLESLAGDESFMDVTLTAQGKAIKAHKSVLSAVSPYFRSVLKQNPCQHPIIIMPRDVRFEELSNIISYVYKGEMTVAAEDLSSLLKTAEVLQVTGLSPSDNNSGSSGIMSQMQGLPSGMFASTSTSSSSSTSKNSSRKSTKVMTHQTNEDTSQLSGSAETMGKIDPLEFLNADMTCVKEEIQSETEADLAEDSNISMSVEASDPISNTPEPMGSPSSSRRKSVGDPLRPGEGLTGKQFNPGDVSSCREESPTHSPSSTDPFVCPYCFETYRPSEVLHTHLRLKHPSKPSFPCSCGKVFIRQSLYTDHKKMCIF